MKAEDYLQLPDVIYETVPVILDSKAKNLTKSWRKMILELEAGEEITVASAAALSNKLQQLANGAIYGENREVFEIHDCKIERFLELIEQLNGKPALVFYNFQHDLSRIQKALAKSGLRVRLLKSPEDQKTGTNIRLMSC